jgi:universal stress protein A
MVWLAREAVLDLPLWTGVTALRVLVGLDFNGPADGVWREAQRLADSLAAPIEVLHVAEDGGVDLDTRESMLRAWLADRGDIPTVAATCRGVPWLELVRRATDRNAAFIVVGSHGRSGFNPLTLGSTAAKLALGAPCPVLIVSARAASDSAARHSQPLFDQATR